MRWRAYIMATTIMRRPSMRSLVITAGIRSDFLTSSRIVTDSPRLSSGSCGLFVARMNKLPARAQSAGALADSKVDFDGSRLHLVRFRAAFIFAALMMER